jgi:hypothetical protein
MKSDLDERMRLILCHEQRRASHAALKCYINLKREEGKEERKQEKRGSIYRVGEAPKRIPYPLFTHTATHNNNLYNCKTTVNPISVTLPPPSSSLIS